MHVCVCVCVCVCVRERERETEREILFFSLKVHKCGNTYFGRNMDIWIWLWKLPTLFQPYAVTQQTEIHIVRNTSLVK
jgi:hypothetical protein